MDTGRPVVTPQPAAAAARVLSATPCQRVRLQRFSPYNGGNLAEEVPAPRFRWQRELTLKFSVVDAAS